MESRITDRGPCLKEIEVVVPPEKIRHALDLSFNNLRTQVVLPGFRPGRVPRNILERRFGEHVRHEVLHDLMKEAVDEAIEEHQLDAISEPSLIGQEEGAPAHSLPAEGPMSFSFTVEVKPEFDLPAYRGVEVTRKVEPVTTDDVGATLKLIAEQRSEWRPLEEGGFEPGDLVIGTITLRAGDEVLADGIGIKFRVEDPLVQPGVRINDPESLARANPDVPVPVTGTVFERFPKEELRGAEVAGEFILEELKRPFVPPIDDELAKQIGFDDLESLERDIQSKLERKHEAEANKKVIEDIVDKLLAATDIPVAEGPVERVLASKLHDLAVHYQQQASLSSEEAMAKASESRDEIRPIIERDTRTWLLIEKIAKKEKIFCLEEDIDEEIAKLARDAGVKPSILREEYQAAGVLSSLRIQIVERKTYAFLKEQAKITEVRPDDEDAEGEAKDASA